MRAAPNDIQLIGHEPNWIGAASNLEISKGVVELKNELERIRERTSIVEQGWGPAPAVGGRLSLRRVLEATLGVEGEKGFGVSQRGHGAGSRLRILHNEMLLNDVEAGAQPPDDLGRSSKDQAIEDGSSLVQQCSQFAYVLLEPLESPRGGLVCWLWGGVFLHQPIIVGLLRR